MLPRCLLRGAEVQQKVPVVPVPSAKLLEIREMESGSSLAIKQVLRSLTASIEAQKPPRPLLRARRLFDFLRLAGLAKRS